MTAHYTLRDIEQRYGARTVLRIPHMEIAPGEILAVVGPSGAGKSTLLRLLAMLETPYGGQLHLRLGAAADPITPHTITISQRRDLAMVFQRPLLLSRSVRENIAYGLRLRGKPDHARIEAMIDRLRLDKVVHASARTLSGGELQRVAIARALITQPRVLLLDEPTANLDPFNISLIEGLLCEEHQQRGMTIVMVTHSIFQARRMASRMAVILDHALVEIGPTEHLFSAPDDPRTRAFIAGDIVY